MSFVRLTYIVNHEEGGYASVYQELGTASCGDTVDEALANLNEAVQVDLLSLEQEGLLEDFLRERGIAVTDMSNEAVAEVRLRLPVGAVVKSEVCSLPPRR
jgi:predicted RNase H-like HicB family nuclease